MPKDDAGSHARATAAIESREHVPHVVLADALEIRCQFCPSQGFRRSRVRAEDLKGLLLMRYPVRCLRCIQRQLVSFAVAGVSVPSDVKHTRPLKANESWKDWTENTTPAVAASVVEEKPSDAERKPVAGTASVDRPSKVGGLSRKTADDDSIW